MVHCRLSATKVARSERGTSWTCKYDHGDRLSNTLHDTGFIDAYLAVIRNVLRIKHDRLP